MEATDVRLTTSRSGTPLFADGLIAPCLSIMVVFNTVIVDRACQVARSHLFFILYCLLLITVQIVLY